MQSCLYLPRHALALRIKKRCKEGPVGTACCVICGIGRLWDNLSQVNLEQQYVESHNSGRR